jgi:hypothetical protein
MSEHNTPLPQQAPFPGEGLWRKNHFRLFLSHNSKDKEFALALKRSLAAWGIDTFVAHADVRPAREWRSEVKLALEECHALGALLTKNFYKSKWTDQEVGFALARRIIVIPFGCGAKPRGFLCDYQVLELTQSIQEFPAERIATFLSKDPRSRQSMNKGLLIVGKKARSKRIRKSSVSDSIIPRESGLFAGTEPTMFAGENLDIPTFMRRGIVIEIDSKPDSATERT